MSRGITDRWRLVEQIFEQVVDLPTGEREDFLNRQCAGDDDLRREVSDLAANLDGADEFVQSCVDDLGWRFARVGRRAGNYRLVREIGAGGMGTVYLAVRDDGQFHQQVAIKLARAGMQSGWALDRFRCERQVLARLTHPNIARLFDGGTLPEGTPYLVMEYIEGRPITTFCRDRSVPLRERLELFLGVCDAVSYAHRNLVIHRDIKPANILVTSEGIPKLLDFGISKLLDPDDQNSNPTTIKLMTPEYASPEQARGEPVTTATDVYSLGAVLYELLTGEVANQLGTDGATGERDVRGSALPRDLDNIVLMALRPEPERRYSSVEQLGSDVRRYLQGLPVLACKDTLLYRAGKFIRRHRTGVVAAVLLALTMLAGIGGVLWQSHRVVQQVRRAERRFVQFRKLANTFLFDFHTRIQNLKDISEARELVLATGIEYIDTLAREANDDPLLARELARAYERFGDLQGFRHEAALARPADALVSYRKAIALVTSLSGSDATAAVLLSRSWCSAGEMIERTGGSPDDVRQSYQECLNAAAQMPPGNNPARRDDLFVRGHALLGDAEMAAHRDDAAMEHYQSILRISGNDSQRPDWKREALKAEAYAHIGRLQSATRDHRGALQSFRTALEQARHANAGTAELSVKRLLLHALEDVASHSSSPPEARALSIEAVNLARWIASEAPHHPLGSEDLNRAIALNARVMALHKSFPSR